VGAGQPVRVLMLLAGEFAFDARVQRSARSLAAHGYDITVAARAGDDERPFDVAGYRVLEVPIRARPKKRKGQARTDERLREQPSALADRALPAGPGHEYDEAWGPLLQRERPDVVHLHDHYGLRVAVTVLRGSARLIYDAHEYSLGKRVTPRRREALAAYLREYVPAVDAFVTVSSAAANAFAGQVRLPAPAIVVHNTPSLRDQKAAPYALRTAVGIDRRTPLLVYHGVLTKQRRLETVFGALVQLPMVHLALIINGSGASALRETAAQMGLRERVHFLPPVPHDSLVSLVRDADVAVLPLERYGNGDVALPNKLFEYLHAEVPMVVSDSPQIAGFVRAHALGEVALLHEGAWARAIERVLTNPGAYAGEPSARRRLRREWSWEAQEPRLLEVYERLARSGRQSSAAAPPA